MKPIYSNEIDIAYLKIEKIAIHTDSIASAKELFKILNQKDVIWYNGSVVSVFDAYTKHYAIGKSDTYGFLMGFNHGSSGTWEKFGYEVRNFISDNQNKSNLDL